MIGYMCKYAPIEILAGFDLDASLIAPNEYNLGFAESYIYPSICSYTKAVLQHSLQTKAYAAVLFTDCCDAMKRVADVLARQPDPKLYTINLPRQTNRSGRAMYTKALTHFVSELEKEQGRAFDIKKFLAACASTVMAEDGMEYIAILGARVSPSLLNECRSLCKLPVRDLTCASQTRHFKNAPNTVNLAVLMEWYADSLMTQTPCLRMADTVARKALLADPALKGIVYHTIKFCDFYNFEYAAMDQVLPILKIETDYTTAGAGQRRTRLEAFFETQSTQKPTASKHDINRSCKAYYAGIDIGSTSTDAVILNSDGQVLAGIVVPTGAKSMGAANLALDAALCQAGLERVDITNMVTTGYGRKAVEFRSTDITEISCHAKGVSHLFPEARTIIDIGGQDSKVIRLDSDGNVVDFSMNDKCAAGTGRFLELIASTLNIPIEQMSELGLHWTEEVTISSMCAVFAESEVISLIAQNKETCDIVRGINLSIASRVAGLAARVHAEGPFVMTGGVAKNKGILLALGQKLGQPILVDTQPQTCGAFGAALFARANSVGNCNSLFDM